MNTKANQSDNEQVTKKKGKDGSDLEEITGADNPGEELNPDTILEQSADNPVQNSEAELIHEKEKYIRLIAEFDNYKKRTIRERTELMKNAGQDIIISLLPVLDDFERALKNLEGVDHTLKEGLLLIHHKLKTILEQKGLTAVEAIGKPFDTDLHEAISNVPAADKMKGKVIDEAEKGYLLNGKVIRHTKVIVGN